MKGKIVRNLQRPALSDTPRHVQLTSESEQLNLEDLVTERTSFFDVLMEKGKEKTQLFKKKSPEQLTGDPVFNRFCELAARMTVVNDINERGNSLIEKYTDMLTKKRNRNSLLFNRLQTIARIYQLHPRQCSCHRLTFAEQYIYFC